MPIPTLDAIGCLPSLPCRHCVKPAYSAPGGKASLVIGSRKNVKKLERNETNRRQIGGGGYQV